MIMSFEELHRVVQLVFVDTTPPRPLNLVDAVVRVQNGASSISDSARLARTTQQRIRQLAEAADPLAQLLGEDPEILPTTRQRVRDSLGQLLIGNVAERVFEAFYRANVGTSELELRDDRSTRGDTD